MAGYYESRCDAVVGNRCGLVGVGQRADCELDGGQAKSRHESATGKEIKACSCTNWTDVTIVANDACESHVEVY